MKTRRLSKTLLATVLMLSLLVSVLPGFGILSVAGTTDSTTWDHTYEVIQNTDSSVAYKDQTNMKDDFKVYRWTHADDAKDVYSTTSLDTGYENGVDMSSTDLRNQLNGAYSVTSWKNPALTKNFTSNDNGYLNFVMEFRKTYALTNVNESAKVDDAFEMETTFVGTSRVGFRNILISKNKGAMNLGTSTATDLIIGLTDDQNDGVRVLVGGAVASASVTGTSGNGKTDQSASIGADSSITKFSYKLGGSNSGYGKATDNTITWHIKVKDGVLQVWNVAYPDNIMTVTLTNKFEGGYVSFVGGNADYTSTSTSATSISVDDGMALASMKWKDILSTEEEEAAAEAAFQAKNEFVYGTDGVFAQNTTTTTNFDEDFVSDFEIYRWAVPVEGGTYKDSNNTEKKYNGGVVKQGANNVPTLISDYPKAIVNTLASNKAQDYGFGYYNFDRDAAWNLDHNGNAATSGVRQSDLYWSTGANYPINYVNSFTHKRVLKSSDDFYMEMTMVGSTNDSANTQGIMIAPKGQFAVTQDDVADTGIFIGTFAKGSVFTTVAGAIDAGSINVLQSSANGNVITDNKSQLVWRIDNQRMNQETMGTMSYTESSGKSGDDEVKYGLITYCVEKQGNVLSVWNKADGRVVIKVQLSEAYAGGSISYIGTNMNRGAFAGMKLTVNPTEEAEETYAFETTSDGLLGANINTGKYPNNSTYIQLDNENLTEDQVAAYNDYIDGNYDLYYTLDGATAKQNAINGNEAGWNMTAGIINRYVGTFARINYATNDDKAGYGALVPTMETMNSGESASLFASDVKVRTGFYFDNSNDVSNQTGMVGLRMAKVGDFTSDGVYLKVTRDSVVLVDGETETTLADYSGLGASRKVMVELDLKLVGTALTGTVTVGEQDYAVNATVSYDEAGFLAIGATGNKLDLDLMDVELVEYVKATTDTIAEDALTVQRVDTDKVGEYKFVVSVNPVDGESLKAGSLTVTNADGAWVPQRDGFQTEDMQSVTYTVYSKSDITVAADFYAPTASEPNFAKIGTSVNAVANEEADGYVGGGLRFVYHADIHQKDGKFYMTIDGAEKEVEDFGAIVALKKTADDLNGGLCYENKDAAYVAYRSVKESGIYYDLCDSYAQFAIQVTNISLLNVENEEITACGYIFFADGTAVSTEAYTTSYSAQK